MGGDARARELYLRYANEYLSSGGNPDYLQASSWHNHPLLTGPESTPLTFMNLIREVLTGVYPRIGSASFYDDEFATADRFGEAFDTGGDGCWTVDTVAEVLDQSCASGSHVANVAGEMFDNLRMTARIGLGAGAGWVGFHLRESTPTAPPWSSGYLVYLKRTPSVGGTPAAKAVLYRQVGGSGKILASVGFNIDPADPWTSLTVDARGNRIRVLVDQELLIARTDLEPDRFTTGYLGLRSLDQAAHIDDLVIERILPLP